MAQSYERDRSLQTRRYGMKIHDDGFWRLGGLSMEDTLKTVRDGSLVAFSVSTSIGERPGP